jgi:UDP-N-acetylglucosamine:LPS N-acetylglucosamine transferase
MEPNGQGMTSLGAKTRVLAVSSGGGHWIELLRLMPAFADCAVTYATVQKDYRNDVAGAPFITLNDATAWNRFLVLILALRVLLAVLRVRPHVVVSTGAAPGYFALRFGKLLGARTIWVDSLANVDMLSKGGRMAGPYADLWLTQWPGLVQPGGPEYSGKVL